jgi:pathogenesis-related protein 1
MKTPGIGLLAACLAGLFLFPEGALAADKKKKNQSAPAATVPELPSPASNTAKGGDQAPATAAEFLQVHNDARARVGAPALRWSDTLARYAQQWADQLASSGTFLHRDQTKDGYGENLFGGSAGFTPGDAARHWLKERSAYKGGPVTAANFNSVGHYTQMVWSGTTEVGYGIATGSNGVVVVANYAPGGNHNGQKPY